MLKILWKRGEIAPGEQFLLLSTIFSYLMLDFYVKTRVRFSLRDKRLFEITEVEITRVGCILVHWTPHNLSTQRKRIKNICLCCVYKTRQVACVMQPFCLTNVLVRCMNGCHAILVLYNSISVISGRIKCRVQQNPIYG